MFYNGFDKHFVKTTLQYQQFDIVGQCPWWNKTNNIYDTKITCFLYCVWYMIQTGTTKIGSPEN